MDRTIRRGDIFYAELNPVIGSEQGGTRPVLIISNDTRQQAQPDSYYCCYHGQDTDKGEIANTH